MKRELIVTADGHDRTVSVEGPLADAGPGTFRVTVDGHERIVDGKPVRPGTWSLVIDGRSFLVDLDRRRTGIAATVGASQATLQVEDALHKRLASAAGPRAVAQPTANGARLDQQRRAHQQRCPRRSGLWHRPQGAGDHPVLTVLVRDIGRAGRAAGCERR